MRNLLLSFLSFLFIQIALGQTAQKPVFFKQPAGFSYVPSAPGKNDFAFYVMTEPVTMKDFRDFIGYLSKNNQFVDASTVAKAIPEDLNPKYKYMVLAQPDPIAIYAAYLSEKLSTKDHIVKCLPISEMAWKQMKGPVNAKLPAVKNPYGITFPIDLPEWKTNQVGKILTQKDVNGNYRGAFRLMLSYIQRNPTKK